MYTRLLRKPLSYHKSFFLLGARGSGKTKWLKTHLPDALSFDLLEAKWRNLFLANPGDLTHFIPKGFDGWVVIDEVQKAPHLLDEVHRLIETHGYRFVLTGSSARKLKQKEVNLLAGRARSYYMHPLIADELQETFDLDTYLSVGGLPEAYLSDDSQAFLHSYVSTYLHEEVLQESLIRQLESFSRFLQSASFSQGSVLNMSSVARECGIKQKTVTNYFSLLEDLLMAYYLPAFTKRAKRRLIHSPKFYFFDVGVYRAIRPIGVLDSTEEVDGAALETVFLQHLRAINDYYSLGYQLSYWRTSDGREVDFVLYGEKGFFAFEIKRTAKIRDADMRGLLAFQADYPEAKCYLIHRGQEESDYKGVTMLPMEKCLRHLRELLG